MLKRGTAMLAALMLLLGMTPARAQKERDIIMVARSYGAWVYSDTVVTLQRDGSRLQFDLRMLDNDIKHDPDRVLHFLRTYGLDGTGLIPDVPPPVTLAPMPAEPLAQIEAQLPLLKEEPFETRFDKTDAGSQLLFALYERDGQSKMTLLREDGSYVGESNDPAAQRLIALMAQPIV